MGKPVQYRSYGGWTYRIFKQFENGDAIAQSEAEAFIKEMKVKGIVAKMFPWQGRFNVYERWQR